jgi:hypothetical protein
MGFHTVMDARIIFQFISGEEQSRYVRVPVSLSLNVAGIVAPFGDLIDPRISGRWDNSEGILEYFIASGEQICAF